MDRNRRGVFRHDGHETWQIGLDERVFCYRNALGLHQLRLLLSRPDERVSVQELAEVCGREVVIQQPCAEEVADAKAVAQVRSALKEARYLLEVAEETGNSALASKRREEVEELERAYNAQCHRNTPRILGSQGNRLRNRVCFTMKHSLAKIRSYAPELGEHLNASLKFGYACGYFPLTPIHWAL